MGRTLAGQISNHPIFHSTTSVSSLVILFLTAFVGIQNEYYSLIPLLVYCLSLPLENKLHKGPKSLSCMLLFCALLDRTLLAHTKDSAYFCDDLEGQAWGWEGKLKEEGICIYLRLIHVGKLCSRH